jgi:AraC-like DNA-binding protein
MAGRDLALGAVARPELGLVEVAFIAGFAEPSAFFRAFRNWTGCTPAEYRRREAASVFGS